MRMGWHWRARMWTRQLRNLTRACQKLGIKICHLNFDKVWWPPMIHLHSVYALESPVVLDSTWKHDIMDAHHLYLCCLPQPRHTTRAQHDALQYDALLMLDNFTPHVGLSHLFNVIPEKKDSLVGSFVDIKGCSSLSAGCPFFCERNTQCYFLAYTDINVCSYVPTYPISQWWSSPPHNVERPSSW